jgi:hypothetical protein
MAPSWPTVAAELVRFAQEHQRSGSFWGSWGPGSNGTANRLKP